MVGYYSIILTGLLRTMIMEAAALRISAYSISTGERTFVDKELAKHGKIKFIGDINDINKISFKKRKRWTIYVLLRKKAIFLLTCL